MTTIQNNQINITISDVEPGLRRQKLIKAIAAAIRWNATSEVKLNTDNDKVYELSALIEVLADTEERII